MLNKLVTKLVRRTPQVFLYFGTMLNKLVTKHHVLHQQYTLNFGTMLNKLVTKPRFNMILCNYYCLS